MSDVSLPRRSPRSTVSAPSRSGGNNTSRGGGSHLKPPALGSFCKNETPIRLAPQEDIDDSPPPGRAALFRAPAARSSLAEPRQSATSCPRSPPPHRGMVRGWLLLHSEAVLLLLPGGGGEEQTQQTERLRKRGRDQCPPPPAARSLRRPSLLPGPRAACGRRARLGRCVQGARRERRGAGEPGASGARGLPTSRARFPFLCYFPGLPRTLASIARN